MAFFEKLFRKPEPPRVETDPRKEEFAARQAKFKELIAKAPRLDVLEKLISTYMTGKETRLRIQLGDGSVSHYTGEQIVQFIQDARRNNNFNLIPTTLGLREKVKELVGKEVARIQTNPRSQELKRHQERMQEFAATRDERAAKEKEKEEKERKILEDIETKYRHQERRPTLEDMKWQVYKLFDAWNGFGEQYHLKRMPEASAEQRTHYSNIVNLKEFAEFVVQDYEETFGPGGRQRAVIDLKTFFDETVPAGVDRNLAFLGIQEQEHEQSFAEILTKNLPQELRNRTLPVRELVAYWNTYSNQDRQFHLLDDFTNTEQKIDLATFAVFVMGKYTGDVKRLQEDWAVFVGFLERTLKERDAI